MAAAKTGKKKTTAKKKTTKTGATKKKTAKAPLKKTATKRTKKPAQEKPKADRSPMYILAIMGLACAVVLLVNKYQTGPDKDKVLKPDNKITVKDLPEKKDGPESAEKKKKEIEGKKKLKAAKNVKKIAKERADRNVKIYLVSFNEKTEEMSLLPFKRRIRSDFPVKGALNELLKGPNKKEKNRGLLTAIPNNLRIRDVKVRKRTAELDFNGAIEKNAVGSILLTRIDQIIYTATQFKEIDKVLIKINGKRKSFLGGDGLSISGPLTRRR